MMKKIFTGIVTLALILAMVPVVQSGKGAVDTGGCSCKGIRLYGKVQVVSSFPDLKVQVVSSFPDLKVQVVNSFPDRCGKWQMVNSFPDFKIQFVNSFPDFTIMYVNSFPGIQ